MWARPAAATEPDPADYGTCIGLEFSLDEPPAAPPQRPAAAPVGAWMRRLRPRPRRG